MIHLTAKARMRAQRVKQAVEKGAFRNLFHAAASIARAAKKSIRRGKRASEAGTPPRTRHGQIRRAIRFAADSDGAVMGPRGSMVGTAGAAHEFGGKYKGQEFDQRAFMFPALEDAAPRFAGRFHGSIGE